MLEWIFRRLDGDADAAETPIGSVPRPEDLDTDGLDLAPDKLAELLSVDEALLREELEQVSRAPGEVRRPAAAEIRSQFEALERELT